MFWASEQKLVDQANTTRRNSWMAELEIEELERNLARNDSCQEEERCADDTGNNLEQVRDILTALEADEEIVNLEEEEVAITDEIAEVLERRQKDKLPTFRDIQKKTIDKRLIKFCVSLKHATLQRLINHFMQELLLLQISWQ